VSELWEHCDTRSQAVLIQLYWDEHGCFPDFYYTLKEGKRSPDIINAPLAAEEEEIETLKEMSQAPEHQERVD
jgi:hypothetical protein